MHIFTEPFFKKEFLMIKLSGDGSLYRQLYGSLRETIVDGEYHAGEKLPSSRELALSLQLSRNIVVSCYEQLNAEGYIVTRSGAGSFVAKKVSNKTKKSSRKTNQKPLLSQSAQKSLAHWKNYVSSRTTEDKPEINFQYGPVAINEPLLSDINRIARRCRGILDSNYQDPAGLKRLRESIARYAQQNRGCRCQTDNIVITNGSQQALDLIARLLLQENDQILIEEPSYRGAAQAFSNAGADLIRCDVDEQGLNPDTFAQLSINNSKIRLIYTTPSHQFPTGAVLSLPRRLRLLEWANSHNAFIIEDDYDSEFRYQGAPIESIQGLDQSGQTIYIGTFSKILSPVLRLGYVILPDSLLEPFLALKWCSDRHSPLLTQHILADFIDSPLFAKHLKRMRKVYGKRRDTLIHALEKHFGDAVSTQGTNAGIHLLAKFNDVDSRYEHELIELAKAKSLGIHSATSLYQNPPDTLALLMGYGNISCEKIKIGVKQLADCYQVLKNG